VLDDAKLTDLISGTAALAALPDPLHVPTLHRELAEGLQLMRVTCPIGVLCIIFESRPEAVVQISTLAIKSGNAVILKGGKEAAHSNAALVTVIQGALAAVAERWRSCGSGGDDTASSLLPQAVQLVSSREDVAALLRLDGLIDVSAASFRGTATAL